MKNLFTQLCQSYFSQMLSLLNVPPASSPSLALAQHKNSSVKTSTTQLFYKEALTFRVLLSIGWLSGLATMLVGCASPPAAESPSPAPTVTSLTAEEIESYAKAILAIEQSRQVASKEIQQMTNSNTVPDITCTKAESIAALPKNIQGIAVNYCKQSKKYIDETQGLTMAQFNAITVTAQSNPELQQRLQSELVRLQNNP